MNTIKENQEAMMVIDTPAMVLGDIRVSQESLAVDILTHTTSIMDTSTIIIIIIMKIGGHQEPQTSEQRQRLVERTQGLADNMRDGDDGNPGLEQKGDKSLDSEAQDDGTADRKNLHINKKWRLLNFQSSASGINYNNVLDNDKYFHIIDDDEGVNSLTGEKMNNKENVYILHQIQSNTLLMDDIDECYVGYGAPKEEDEWENEVDPYASERSRIRRTKLEDYDKFRKDDIKFYEGKWTRECRTRQ
nr:hypothetical protein BgiMline_035014 [Biomphalaria glabrata]